ncbi:Malate dehydrogenase [Sodalis praecaptivus]|nr:Malate dehydrogenase [Sodalis praecaptivus]
MRQCGIGQALALLLTTRLPQDGELSLYDIAPVTAGIAVDLSHIPSPVKVRGFCGPDASPALLGADIVLIVAGVARKPGMDRADLFNVNAGIVRQLVGQVAVCAPEALIGIVTNPVNTLVAPPACWRRPGSISRKSFLVSPPWTSSALTVTWRP